MEALDVGELDVDELDVELDVDKLDVELLVAPIMDEMSVIGS